MRKNFVRYLAIPANHKGSFTCIVLEKWEAQAAPAGRSSPTDRVLAGRTAYRMPGTCLQRGT